MSVTEALQKRVSVRAFLPSPVPPEIIRRILSAAQLAPSNCNVQPWQIYVASGETQEKLRERLVARAQSGKISTPDFDWSVSYDGEFRERQIGAAVALYSTMGIDRKDREGRTKAMLRNFAFFDAPHSIFFAMDKSLGLCGAVDIGIYAQSLALLMIEHGIASCFQGALNQFPEVVREEIDIPDRFGILFGMSFGYADTDATVNATRTVREPLEKLVTFAD